MGEEEALRQGRDASLEGEARVREQQALDKLTKMKEDRDSITDKLAKSGILVELRENVARFKKFTMEEFKSSFEFQGAVEDAASKYFGEGFDFYK